MTFRQILAAVFAAVKQLVLAFLRSTAPDGHSSPADLLKSLGLGATVFFLGHLALIPAVPALVASIGAYLAKEIQARYLAPAPAPRPARA